MHKICLGFILFILVSLNPLLSFAQEENSISSTGIGNYLKLIDANANDGDIVSSTEKGYSLSKIPYDHTMYGVVTRNPAISFGSKNLSNAKPIVSSGKAYVKVSTLNGGIKDQDSITSSSRVGVGQKGDKNGFILGTALEPYTDKDPQKIGKILVFVNPRYN